MYSLTTKWDPCNEHHLTNVIRENKRIDRLRQVRAQAREVAAQIRRSFQEEKQRALRELEEREARRKEFELRSALNAAEQEYQEAVSSVGAAQREAENRVQEKCGVDRLELQREEETKRKQRFAEARDALQREREAQNEMETRRARARERALQAERERAIAVANRSPPSPNPLDSLKHNQSSRTRPAKALANAKLNENVKRRSSSIGRAVAVTDRDAFSTTHYHIVPVGELVRRSADFGGLNSAARTDGTNDGESESVQAETDGPASKNADALKLAENTERHLAELAAERQRCENLRRERARERGAVALKRETLRKHYSELLGDLSTLQRLDTHRKAAHFYHVPRSLFLGNRQSDAERAREQRKMEERLEKLVEDEPVVLSTTLPLRVADERARLASPSKSGAVDLSARLRTSSVSPFKQDIVHRSPAKVERRTTRSANASPKKKPAARFLGFGFSGDECDDDDEIEPQPRSRPLSAVGDYLRDRTGGEAEGKQPHCDDESVPQHLASLYAQLRGTRLSAQDELEQPDVRPRMAPEGSRTDELQPAAIPRPRTNAEYGRAEDLRQRQSAIERSTSPIRLPVEADADADRTLVEEEVQTDRIAPENDKYLIDTYTSAGLRLPDRPGLDIKSGPLTFEASNSSNPVPRLALTDDMRNTAHRSLQLPPGTVEPLQISNWRTYDPESARTTHRLLESDRLRTIAREQIREIDEQLATYRVADRDTRNQSQPIDSVTSRSTSRASDAIEVMRQAAESDRTIQSGLGSVSMVHRSRVDSSSSSNPRSGPPHAFDLPSATLDLTIDSASISGRSDGSRKGASRNRIREYQLAALNRLRTAQSSSLPSVDHIECAVALAPPKQLDRSSSTDAESDGRFETLGNRPAVSVTSRDVSVRLGSSFTATNVSSLPSTRVSPAKAGLLKPEARDARASLHKLISDPDWRARLEQFHQDSALQYEQFSQAKSTQSAELPDEGEDYDLANDAFVPHQLSVIREADGTSRFIVSTSQIHRSLLGSARTPASGAKKSPQAQNASDSSCSTIELSEHSHSSISLMTPISNTEAAPKDAASGLSESQKELAAEATPMRSDVEVERVKKLALFRYLRERSAHLASVTSASTLAETQHDAVDGAYRSDDSDSNSVAPAALYSPQDDAARGEALRTLMQSALTIDLAALSASYTSAISSRAASQLDVPKADDVDATCEISKQHQLKMATSASHSRNFESPLVGSEQDLERNSSRRAQGHDYSTSSILQSHAAVEKSMLSQLSLSTIENSASPSSAVRIATETSSSSDSPQRFSAAEATPVAAHTQTQSTVTNSNTNAAAPTLMASVNIGCECPSASRNCEEDQIGVFSTVDVAPLPHDQSVDTEADISLISLSSTTSTAAFCSASVDEMPFTSRTTSSVRSTIAANRDTLQPDAVRLAELVLSANDESLIPDSIADDHCDSDIKPIIAMQQVEMNENVQESEEQYLPEKIELNPLSTDEDQIQKQHTSPERPASANGSDDTLTDCEGECEYKDESEKSTGADPNNNSNEERSSNSGRRSRNVVRFDEHVQEIDASLLMKSVASASRAQITVKRESRRRSSQVDLTRAAEKAVKPSTRSRSVSSERAKKRLDREREYLDRTRRLWNQLDEVRHKREQRMREQQYAANRERAQQYAKLIDERRRKSSSHVSPSQVHSD